jgi:predicted ATPase/DNA-binding SARP family transcriptional activator
MMMHQPSRDSRRLGGLGGGVTFSILGPLEVRTASGAPIQVSSHQQRMLLAVLLLDPNTAVTIDALIEALWPNEPPSAAHNAVQVHVSKLRDLLEPRRARRSATSGLLATGEGGYTLRVSSQQVDALRFERLVVAGRASLAEDPPRAHGCLENALSLWRGPPLGELQYESFASPWVRRMEELRLSAIESRLDARLALGAHAEVAVELAALVHAHPDRERFRAQQMLALYRCGRTAQALSVYRSARRVLLDELGLEPGPELAALERAILRQERSLLLRPKRVPEVSGGTVGTRSAEPAAFVCALWDPATVGAPQALGAWEIALFAEERGGRVLAVDGARMVASFANLAPALTVAAALAADQARPARTAVHAGHGIVLGRGWVGPAPARAQRLAEAAHPGQVLVSAAAAELVDGRLPEGMGLRELGATSLADLGRPERLSQLVHDQLADEFPPLRSLDDVPHNLPVYQDAFIGREAELRKISAFLEQSRLVTLTGAGGCGKTRLAIQAAAELIPAFGDGVFVVELAALADPRLVAGAVAAAVGLPENPRLPMVAVVTRHLSDRRVLVVLDTCEHLRDACAELVEKLTAACPEVCVLATSRERLGVPGEQVWDVPPLAVPDAIRSVSRQASVFETDAGRLLIERATALRPDLQITPAGAEATVRICRRLGGVPLAIELAAARVPALGVEHVADRLERKAGDAGSLALRRGAGPAALKRHETMELALDWSYDLLSTEERLLLSRLAVFAGSFTLEEAAGIAVDRQLGRADLDELVARLVEKSMVVADDPGEGHVRYRLLEPIRDYAAAKLATGGQADELRRRHAEWFLALAEEGEAGLHGAEERDWLDRFEAAHDNLRAALSWATERRVGDLAVRLAGAMWWFWYTHGYLGEGRDWLGRALALPAPAALRAKAVHASAHLAAWQGDYTYAIAACKEVLSDPEQRDGRWGAWSRMGLAAIETVTAETLDHALGQAEESVSLLRALGRDWELGYAVMTLAHVAYYRGEYERAAEAFDESIRIQRELGQTPALGVALRYRGLVAALSADHARARALCEESLLLASQHDDRTGMAQSLNCLATAARYEGDLARVRPCYCQALGIALDVGEFLDIRWALEGLAGVACADSQLELSTRLLACSQAMGERSRYRLPPAERAAHNANVKTVRDGLPAHDFESAWAAGGLMSIQQAVEEANALADDDLLASPASSRP